MALEPADPVGDRTRAQLGEHARLADVPARRRAGESAPFRSRRRRRPPAGARSRSRGRQRSWPRTSRWGRARTDDHRTRGRASDDPSDEKLAERLEREAMAEPPSRLLVDGDRPGRRGAHDALGDLQRVADGGALRRRPARPCRGPVAIPIRTAKSGTDHALGDVVAYSPTTSRIRSAVRTARSGSSSWAPERRSRRRSRPLRSA